MIALQLLAFGIGLAIVAATLTSAVRTFVLPRGSSDPIVQLVFVSLRQLFDLMTERASSYEGRDRIMAFYAPISLLALLPTWLILIGLGYAAMFWALGAADLQEALRDSGSSLLTLGFAPINDIPRMALAFTEATIGLMLVALLISYLPTMYAAFSRRESAVTLLEVRAGMPPSPLEMIKRFHRIQGLGKLSEQWRNWEMWFADIAESHTSLAALVFFRSPQPRHSWVNAAGTVMDAASLILSVVDVPNDPQAALCIRSGYLALRQIAGFFGVRYVADPRSDDPISISRQEFDEACAELAEAGVPLIADRDRAWRDFAGWRVNYDVPLLALAGLTLAPEAQWTGDRAVRFRPMPLQRRRR